MRHDEEPPFLGSSLKHNPYTVEGQIEQYGALGNARGWRRIVAKVIAFAVLAVFVGGVISLVMALR